MMITVRMSPPFRRDITPAVSSRTLFSKINSPAEHKSTCRDKTGANKDDKRNLHGQERSTKENQVPVDLLAVNVVELLLFIKDVELGCDAQYVMALARVPAKSIIHIGGY